MYQTPWSWTSHDLQSHAYKIIGTKSTWQLEMTALTTYSFCSTMRHTGIKQIWLWFTRNLLFKISKKTYTNDSSNDEVKLYTIEAVSRRNSNTEKTTCHTNLEEANFDRWRNSMNQVWLRWKLLPKEQKCFCYMLRKFIHFFDYNYKDLWEVVLEAHRIELVHSA